MITLYSRANPPCPHCIAAKKYLDNHGIEYTNVDVVENPEAMDYIKSRGAKSIPQIYVGEHVLCNGNSGLQAMTPDEVRAKVAELSGQ